MHRFTSSIRRPVKRQGAEQYLLITLLSFAASVIFTRLFLELTGYPQLGGGDLHIAHVLWGGLLLFVASLLPLVVANRWVYTIGGLLSGIGVGLFIDEVGKFITQTNDYFYPLAAPIIYAFFLLTVLVYLRVRRPPSGGARAELYRAFDAMEEVLEHDLDPEELDELQERLRYVADQQEEPVLARLAEDLLGFLTWEELQLAPPRPLIWTRIQERWKVFEARWVNGWRLRLFIGTGLLGLGLLALANMSQALLPVGPDVLEDLFEQLFEQGLVQDPSGLRWFLVRLGLETAVGLVLLISAGLMVAGKDRLGSIGGSTGLLLSLVTVNLLVFYFDQFSTIITALLQFGLLLLISYYRQSYLVKPGQPHAFGAAAHSGERPGAQVYIDGAAHSEPPGNRHISR